MPDFALTPTNSRSVALLCAALEGIPLAIELAAARIRVLTPQAMLDRLDDRYRLLSRGYRDVPDRQRSLEASVMWSYELCTTEECLLWSRLSVYRGGFGLESAEEVCAGDGIEPDEVLDLLSGLVDKSIVMRDDDGVAVRYRMLEAIRQFGAARLVDDNPEAWRARHRDWYRALADRCSSEWVGPDQVDWLSLLRKEHANLQAALGYCLEVPGGGAAALQICIRLEAYWICSGRLTEARRWLVRAISDGTGSVNDRLTALRLSTWFSLVQMDVEAAQQYVLAMGPLVGASADDLSQAEYELAQGTLLTWVNRAEEGSALVESSLETFHAKGDVTSEVFVTVLLGLSLALAGEPERAVAAQERCLGIGGPRGEMYMRGFALVMLALDALSRSDIPHAEELARAGLQMKSALGDQMGIALSVEALSWIAASAEQGERAAVLMGAAERYWGAMAVPVITLPLFAIFHQINEQATAELLSPSALENALARGRKMTQLEAIEFALGSTSAPAPSKADKSPLTPRETEVARLVSDGLSNADIAHRLVISQRTAETHVENILRKLGFSSRAAIASWIASRGEAHRG